MISLQQLILPNLTKSNIMEQNFMWYDNESCNSITTSSLQCRHSSFMDNKCARCTQSIADCGNPVTIPFGYIHPHLSHTLEEIDRLRDENLQCLLERKKLHLVLDLDHTLVHATKIMQPMLGRESTESMNDFHEILDSRYMIKIRPGVHEFLEQVSSMFDLSIYTRSVREYAHKVVEVLNSGDGLSKFSWVITREDCLKHKRKGLDVVLSHERVVLIVDDKERVWEESGRENLIKIRPYFYIREEEDMDEEDMDDELDRVLNVLKEVHNGFYDDNIEFGKLDYGKRDVREVLKRVLLSSKGYLNWLRKIKILMNILRYNWNLRALGLGLYNWIFLYFFFNKTKVKKDDQTSLSKDLCLV